ncbi:MAG: hypothetical protein RBT59_07625 [Arcobacteraceae bacterium]|jgi:hypothetical protein|nr:hypothetical protein [Arcobacteraceae bacterium]
MKLKKWFIGYLKKQDKENFKYILIDEINKDDFRKQINRVYDYEYLENLYMFIINNFKDFQKSIKDLDQESKNNTEDINNYFLQNHQVNIQRTFFNLINSHRLLIDHMKHTLSSYNNKNQNDYDFLSEITSFYYDTFAGYKIIDNLRNYCQHRSLAPLELIRSSDGNIKIFINKDALREDKKIKNKIKLELDKDIPLNFIYLIKEWFENIQEIYNYYFDLFAKYSKEDADLLLSHFSFIKNNLDKNNLELYLVAGYTKDSIDQYSYLPTKSALRIIERIQQENFSKNIDFISNFTEKQKKNKEKNDKLKSEFKKYGLELPEIDTLTLSSINRYLRDK